MQDSRGFTLIELLLVLLILGILMAISMANYRNARLLAAEGATITSLTAINQAQYSYSQVCGQQRFAPHLTSLGKANPASGQAFLSPDMTASDDLVKSGYRIQMSGTAVEEVTLQSCTGETPVVAYQVTADPTTPGWSGNRFFGTNVNLVIYENNESFVGKMPETGPPTIGQETKGRAAQ